MKNKRLVQFAMAGLLAAVSFQIVGYFLARPSGAHGANSHVVFNWLNLLFAPVAFLFRVADPDSLHLASTGKALLASAGNSLLYAAACCFLRGFFVRENRKLAALTARATQNSSAGAKRAYSSPSFYVVEVR